MDETTCKNLISKKYGVFILSSLSYGSRGVIKQYTITITDKQGITHIKDLTIYTDLDIYSELDSVIREWLQKVYPEKLREIKLNKIF